MDRELILLSLAYLVLSFIGTYLAFYVGKSNSWIRRFAVWDNPAQPDFEKKNEAINRFIFSNSLRAVILILIAAISIALLSKDHGGTRFILSNKVYQAGVIVMVVYSLIWALVIGPRKLAKLYKQPWKFREHFVPYLCDLPTIMAPLVIMGPLIFGAVILSLQQDYQFVYSEYVNISKSLRAITTPDLLKLQKSLLDLVFFGDYLSQVTQKYVSIGILALLYSIAEGHTYMSRTIVPESIDKIRGAAYLILVISFVFGIILLPNIYFQLYHVAGDTLARSYTGFTEFSSAKDFLDIFNLFEDHNVKWYYAKSLTGYGNLVTYVIIGFALLIKNVAFKKATIDDTLKFLFPTRIYLFIRNFVSRIGYRK